MNIERFFDDRITLINGDCLDVMPRMKAGLIDMTFADLPYGTTACKWDSIIPLETLWPPLRRVNKLKAPMIFTTTQPFSSVLVTSNIDQYRYEWVWSKNIATGYQIVKYKPLQKHETIQVFYREPPVYNPQMTEGKAYTVKRKPKYDFGKHLYGNTTRTDTLNNGTRYPTTIQAFDRETGFHPTQKPIKLIEYLIKTYTNKDDLVFDPTMGSGTTAVACVNTNRRFIGVELDETYFGIAIRRVLGDL